MKTLKRFAHLGLRLWLLIYNRFVSTRLQLKLKEPTLIVANHASHLDILAICATIPLEEIPNIRVAAAKDHIFAQPWPAVLAVKFLFNVFPFERNKRSSNSLARCSEYLEQGFHVILFPEGRRSADGTFLGFTHGFAKVAYRTGAPVIAMKIKGSDKALARGTLLPLQSRICVEIGKPLRADRSIPWDLRHTAYRDLVERAEEEIAA